jgi:hypothetical protein
VNAAFWAAVDAVIAAPLKGLWARLLAGRLALRDGEVARMDGGLLALRSHPMPKQATIFLRPYVQLHRRRSGEQATTAAVHMPCAQDARGRSHAEKERARRRTVSS